MTRERICNALLVAAAESGYTTYSGWPEGMAARIVSYPAVWLMPLRLTGIKGRHDGQATYHVELRMIADSSPRDAAEAERIWGRLENDAATIVKLLETDAAVEFCHSLRCTPLNTPLTKGAQTALTAEFDVVTLMCM